MTHDDRDPTAPAPPGLTAPALLVSDDALAAALAALETIDPTVVPGLLAQTGLPTLRLRPPGFAGLAAIVVSQQLSTQSAAAILWRLEAAVTPLDAATLSAAADETLRRAGLSGGKIKTLRAIESAVQDGSLPLAGLAALPEAEARARLLAVSGIGPWTADVFLLFCIGHPDAWPAGDIALQEAARIALGAEKRFSTAEMLRVGERWRPLRGAAAYLLWRYYRVAKGRTGQPIVAASGDPA